MPDEKKTTIWDDCVAARLETDHHESDLYVLDTPEARAIMARHGKPLAPFRGTDGRPWLDAAFEYLPFWDGSAKTP